MITEIGGQSNPTRVLFSRVNNGDNSSGNGDGIGPERWWPKNGGVVASDDPDGNGGRGRWRWVHSDSTIMTLARNFGSCVLDGNLGPQFLTTVRWQLVVLTWSIACTMVSRSEVVAWPVMVYMMYS